MDLERLGRLITCALLVPLLALAACNDDKPNGDNNGAGVDLGGNNGNPGDMSQGDADPEDMGGDVSVEDEPDVPQVVCEPNQIVRCIFENTPDIEVCNFRGTDTVNSRCEGTAVCRQGECVDVECIPGTRVCLSETQPATCTSDGAGYEPGESCGDGVTCAAGACQDLCTQAENLSSYIGCEYWPVELENNLLYDEDDTSTPEAPFAVVLSNPQAEPGKVTVYTPEGEVLDAIPEVYIPVGLINPLFMSTTVYSQVLEADGTMVGEPLEGPLQDIEVPAGGLLQVIFPRRTPIPYATSIDQLAWHVVTDRPMVAYQFNPICCNYSFTNDASILLPRSALTKRYMAMSFPSWRPSTGFLSPATLTVVATEDDTEVTVNLGPDRVLYPGTDPRLNGQPDDVGVLRVTLQAQEVLNLEATETRGLNGEPVREVDLTGATVESTKPIAVFGGHSCTNIPFSQAACDHIEQQLFPIETWGRNFIASPLKIRGPGAGTREATYWKLLAQRDGTQIVLDRPFTELMPLPQAGPQAAVPNCRDKLTRPDIITLNAGEFCEFGTRIGFGLDADQPILMGAFMSGQVSTDLPQFGEQAGDPAFFLVPPSEQLRTEYDFLTPPTYALDFVTVTALQGVRIYLDGELIDLTEYDSSAIDTRGYIYAHIPIENGPHRITGDAPFGIVVYAYDDFVSYAYTGGLDLKKINPQE